MDTERIEVVVGRIGKPHGLRGEVTVEVRTDEPERRFVAGSTLAYALCAIGLVLVLNGHHPITHLIEILRHLGGH